MTPLTTDFVPRLRAALARRTAATLADAEAQRAAVAVVVAGAADPAMLFVKRREREGDPWSGHVAFPGGFSSPGDASPAVTAARETEEETGLALSRLGEQIGVLDDVYPRSRLLPKVIVTPVVFVVPDRLPVTASDEVERAFWLPVADLYASENRRPLVLELPTGRQEFDSIVLDGHTIWGLTERVLSQIATIIE